MEHYILLGLAALVFGTLLFTIGPRMASTTNGGGNDIFSSSLPREKFPPEPQTRQKSSAEQTSWQPKFAADEASHPTAKRVPLARFYIKII